jgi:hypothetical protein
MIGCPPDASSNSPMTSAYFQKPGVYALQWYGADFKAPTITFRVMPLQAYRPLGKDEMK